MTPQQGLRIRLDFTRNRIRLREKTQIHIPPSYKKPGPDKTFEKTPDTDPTFEKNQIRIRPSRKTRSRSDLQEKPDPDPTFEKTTRPTKHKPDQNAGSDPRKSTRLRLLHNTYLTKTFLTFFFSQFLFSPFFCFEYLFKLFLNFIIRPRHGYWIQQQKLGPKDQT